MENINIIIDRLLAELTTDLEKKLGILLEGLNFFLGDIKSPYQLYKVIKPQEAEKDKSILPANSCCICKKTFKKQFSLIDHVGQIHFGYCWICGVQRGYELQEIIGHNRKVHLVEFPFICKHCGRNFGRNQQYKTHILKRHNNDLHDPRKGFCTECNGNFRSLKQLVNHLQATGHSTNSQYFCKKCDKNVGILKKLEHTCQEKTKTCQICSTTFETRSNMLRHQLRHSKTEKDFVCDQCGAKYYSVDSLKEHCFLAHSLEAEIVHYQCDICEKKFRLKRLLKRHVQSHFVEGGHFECEPCAKTYMSEAQLNRHNRNSHKLRKKSRKIDKFAFDENGDAVKVLPADYSYKNEKLTTQPMPNNEQPPTTCELPPTVFAIEFSDLLPVPQQSVKVLHFVESM